MEKIAATAQRRSNVLLGSIIIVAAIVFLHTIITAMWYSPQTEILVPTSTLPIAVVKRDASQNPIRLSIPTLSIDASVEEVGLVNQGDSKNLLGVPSTFSNVAWYKYGPQPGMNGSAVIDGHVDDGYGFPGVFKELGTIQVGDSIFVTRKDKTKLRFIVTEVANYPYTEVPRDKLFSIHDTARLNLISCSGRWTREGNTYDHRLVVYSILVP